MKCPICNQEVQPSDHSEQWGPEFAHSRCVVAFNAGSAVQDAKLLIRIKRLEEAGNALSHYLREMPYAISDYLAQLDERSLRINNWRKAKEVKL